MKEIAAKQNPLTFNQADPQFEYGQRFHYFGVLAAPNMSPADPSKVVRQWMKLSTYCKRYQRTPVAIFYEPNTALAWMCKRLGFLTICATYTKERPFDKVVDAKPYFSALKNVYWLRIDGSEPPDVLEEIQAHDGSVIELGGAVPDVQEDRKAELDPRKRVKDAQPEAQPRADDYENFPLPDNFTELDEPSLPLEMPEGLRDIIENMENNSREVQDGLRTRSNN